MDDACKNNVLLQTARCDFSWFYLNGTPREKQLMDMLVLTTSLIVRLRKGPATADPGHEDWQETRETAERAFIELREKIRTCATFAALPGIEQQAIVRVIFQRGPGAG